MSENPIDEYLDDLYVQLGGSPPRDARSLLWETESHLRDTATALERGGLSVLNAETEAVRRFGGAAQLAAADRQTTRTSLLKGVVVSGWTLGALGAVAVGLSGVIAAIMRFAGASNQFIARGSTTNLNPSDCARWQNLYPHAQSCRQAALNDWTGETIFYRIGLGVAGAIAVGLLLLARRHTPARRWVPLPGPVVDTIATTAFGITGIWLAGLGIDALAVNSGHGAGQWLSAAPVALITALMFGVRLVRNLNPAQTA